ncbi:hypothetical protein MNB_SUP05-5-1021 [hydrothermal vent metagenome]|uniref:Phospholipid-binding protein n=1 Tax=hydrothermal vent metagenome TaxID=652676 RepID=A0A1W1CS04_9ZZZZ
MNRVIYLVILLPLVFVNKVYAFEDSQLPEVGKLVIGENINKNQANQMVLTARKYAAFWNTGVEKYAKQALSDDFIDLNLPQGRKQGIQGPLDASKWFRGVVPNLSAKIKEMIVAKNQVVSHLEFTGNFTGKFHNTIGKGQKINFSAVDIYTIQNGKIQTNWHLEDNKSLIDQLTKYPSTKGFKLSSNTVKDGKSITANQYWNNFGCSGKNERPDLFWSGVPKGAKSLAVSLYDKDAPTGSGFWHWTVYNIPVNIKNIHPNSLPKGAIDANTDMGKPGYLGPCPPVGRIHNYIFTLYALDVEKLTPPEGATSALVRFFINQHIIAKTTLSVIAGPRK